MGKRGKTGEHLKGRVGPASNSWQGGRHIGAYGYMYVWVGYEHPMADYKGRVVEHRLILSKVLGRMLTKDELVHHIDGDKLNNSPENLELTTRAAHMHHHVTWDRQERPCAACGLLFVPPRKPRRERSCCSRQCSLKIAHRVNHEMMQDPTALRSPLA